MKKMQIFEPAMCCSTGLCGVGIDQELLRISTVLNTLKNKGVYIDRFNLSNEPQEFVMNESVKNYMNEKGLEGLPLVMIEDVITITGRYPSNEEFIKLLEIPENYLEKQASVQESEENDNQDCECTTKDCCC